MDLQTLAPTHLFSSFTRIGGEPIYFLVYVDDLLITGTSSSLISRLIKAVANRFSIKDFGASNSFLGVEAISTPHGLFLTQHKYIRDLLERTHMEGAKEVQTPLETTGALRLFDGFPPANATAYRQMIGALQYLSITRPDIAFAVNKLAQFMHRPTQTHLAAAKRLLRYLKGTLYHGWSLSHSSTPFLHAYSDADWAGNADDRTSTSAFVIFLGGNPISWSSRKQRSVARSSTEAEYRAVATTAAELAWVYSLLIELGHQTAGLFLLIHLKNTGEMKIFHDHLVNLDDQKKSDKPSRRRMSEKSEEKKMESQIGGANL